MNKYHIVGKDWNIKDVFNAFGMTNVRDMQDADVVVFTGGHDIGAKYYNLNNHPSMVWTRPERDEFEVAEYKKAVGLDKYIAGICRGGQLGHILNGGKMHQDVDNHTYGTHFVLDRPTKRAIRVTSCHHQMMRYDPALPCEVVATAAESTYRKSVDVNQYRSTANEKFKDDIEVLWYPNTKTLCYQGHPEFGLPSCTQYFRSLMQRYGMMS